MESIIRIIVKMLLLFGAVSAASASDSFKFTSNSTMGIYEKAAVSTMGPECAQIGSDIMLLKNGSAVDAAIAAMLCEGVASPHSTGLGGGFFMTIYDAPSGKATFLDARETAPGLANETMYGGNKTLSFREGLSIAVPGELMGYWEAHQKYGRIPWKELFEPTIELCKTGAVVTKYLENHLYRYSKEILASPTVSEIVVDPETRRVFRKGDKMKRPKLAKTLREIADAVDPVELVYRGRIAKQLVDEIKSYGGIITEEDFSNYKVKWTAPITSKIGEMTLFTAPPPGSGALLAFMLNVLKDLIPANNEGILWQRFVETFKWAYAKRTELADPDFVDIAELIANVTSQDYANTIRSLIKDDKTHTDPKYYGAVTVNTEDGGTSHVSVLAPDGSGVSLTSSINHIFGAMIMSPSTGIVLNDEMSDFSAPGIINPFLLPPSPNNFIKPFKRPFSSMAPTILIDKNGKVVVVIGAAGGTRITAGIASVMALYLWNDFDIKEAIDARRIYHQLLPMKILKEHGFPEKILDFLVKIGHSHDYAVGIGSAVTAIAVKNGYITANSDHRRQGNTAGF